MSKSSPTHVEELEAELTSVRETGYQHVDLLLKREGRIAELERELKVQKGVVRQMTERADKYEAKNKRQAAALQGIAKLGPLCLIGGDGMAPREAYSVGAHNAFGQAAEMAETALASSETAAKPLPAGYMTDEEIDQTIARLNAK